MPFIPGTLVKADDTLNRAVQNALSESFYKVGEKRGTGYHRSALNSNAIASASGGEQSGYQGYFTITDASEEGQGGVIVPKIKVWDPRTPGSQSQPCYVNSYREDFSAWTSGALSGTMLYVCIHYHAATESSGTVGTNSYQTGTEESFGIEIRNSAPGSDTSTDVWYQIGRVEVENGAISKIYQDHVTGIIRMFWFSNCGT